MMTEMARLPMDAWIGIFAHPDDEWVAGWPVFQYPDVELGVVFFVGDNRLVSPGIESPWERVLRPLLESLGIELLGCLGCAPDFYREPRLERAAWRAQLDAILERVRTGRFANAGLLTHNPVGEYGHPDHIEVMRALMDIHTENPIYMTDICYDGELSLAVRRTFYSGLSFGPFELARDRWVAARAAYQRSYKWTAREWPGQTSARLFHI